MKHLLMIAMALLISTTAFANFDDSVFDDSAFGSDDDYTWSYCSEECGRIIGSYTMPGGMCYLVMECDVREWDEEQGICVKTGEKTQQTQTYVCPRPAPMPPLPPRF